LIDLIPTKNYIFPEIFGKIHRKMSANFQEK